MYCLWFSYCTISLNNVVDAILVDEKSARANRLNEKGPQSRNPLFVLRYCCDLGLTSVLRCCRRQPVDKPRPAGLAGRGYSYLQMVVSLIASLGGGRIGVVFCVQGAICVSHFGDSTCGAVLAIPLVGSALLHSSSKAPCGCRVKTTLKGVCSVKQ